MLGATITTGWEEFFPNASFLISSSMFDDGLYNFLYDVCNINLMDLGSKHKKYPRTYKCFFW